MTEKTSPIALEDRAEHGVRMSSPSAARNREPITLALKDRLPEGARVLEIASGTGEHALAVVSARPDLSWTPSDPDPRSRASQNAWAEDAEGRIRPSLDPLVAGRASIRTVRLRVAHARRRGHRQRRTNMEVKGVWFTAR